MKSCFLTDHHAYNLAYEANVALGFRGVARALLCPIGSAAYNGGNLRARLKDARDARQSILLWARPENAELDKGLVDIEGIPSSASLADALDALREHVAATDENGQLIVTEQGCSSTYGELGGPRSDGHGLRYRSPAIGVASWIGTTARLRTVTLADGRPFLRPSMGWEPSGGTTWGSWFTSEVLAILRMDGGFVDAHPYDAKDGPQNEKRWAICAALHEMANKAGIATAVFECGSVIGLPIPADADSIVDGQERVNRYLKRLVAHILAHDVRGWEFPPNSRFTGYAGWVSSRYAPAIKNPVTGNYDVFPPGGDKTRQWKGSPPMVTFLKKLLAQPEFIKLPLLAPAA